MPLEAFHPTLRAWFAETFTAPTEPQRQGWPAIRSGAHTLIAAPTGTGKTLAAFAHALDGLLRQGPALPDACQVLYVSPLKALSNDVRKNLLAPLAALRERDPALPDVRVAVRTGDTPGRDRQGMLRTPPHVLVTTPESLYVLLGSAGGVGLLGDVRTVIVDEIHALAADRRGAHLALSLERLVAVAGEFQRIGLSATQKPITAVRDFLAGVGRECRVVDAGHLRQLDVGVEVPALPLTPVCSEEHWADIVQRMLALIEQHRTTLVFTNTRKMAERLARRLAEHLGDQAVTSHHGSLSRERRLDAEQRLKSGSLRALVATASLELGIDIGDVDLVIQAGATQSIAQLLQRVGRAGHATHRVPKGRIFPLTQDELVAATALLQAIERGELDALCVPVAPLDVLAQQVVAACVQQEWNPDELHARFRRAWPYRELGREDFDRTVDLHVGGRLGLLHRDGVQNRLLATKRARLPALTSGGAIPDRTEYQVVLDPDGTHIGSVDEDFAVESSIGDVFQLGNASWQVLKIEAGRLRVADAKGAPPSLPFWFGEAPARTDELCAAIDTVRVAGADAVSDARFFGLSAEAEEQLRDYLRSGREALGAVPTRRCIVLERFFDESGGMQLVVHAPFGSRINRAFGLALRKRFCRGFGFELQAAANEEAIVLSLGPVHAFPLEEVFDYLHPATAEKLLVQAVLPTPLFKTRWRWNVTRSLVVPRTRAGSRVPAPLLRMRAEDALAAAFPEVQACGENLPPGDLPVPLEHPLVRQTIIDCLHEAMDVDGLLALLRGLRDSSIERVAIDRPEPSPFARGILNAAPYAFLDDAPLEERRTQAVIQRHALDPRAQDTLGALDPDAVAHVREQAWPQPQSADELHEALCWMGFATVAEVERSGWPAWIAELLASGRVARDGERWFATEATRDPKAVLVGRLEALGPIESDDPLLRVLEAEGVAMRCRLDGREHWCHRRLLARIHRETLETLRSRIAPVAANDFLRFLATRQHVAPGYRLEGPAGVQTVVAQLSGLEVPAWAWEKEVLHRRVEGYRAHWIDQLTLSGELAWLRLWGSGAGTVRNTPLCVVPRQDLHAWLDCREPVDLDELGRNARTVFDVLAARGALFPLDLERAAGLLPSHLEEGLAELIARGLATCDSFAALRQLTIPPAKRTAQKLGFGVGRWSLLPEPSGKPDVEFVLDRLLARWGVVFWRLLLRERIPVRWRDLLRAARARELAGTLRGGRFVAGFSGEQFALPDVVTALRRCRQEGPVERIEVAAADPLNLRGILTPDARVPTLARQYVEVCPAREPEAVRP